MLENQKEKEKSCGKKEKADERAEKGHFGGDLMRSASIKTETSPFCPIFRPLTGFLFPPGTFPCLVLFSPLKTQILRLADFFRIAYMYFSPRRKKIRKYFVIPKNVSTFAVSKQIFYIVNCFTLVSFNFYYCR